MSRRTSKSAIFLGMLLATGIVVVAFFLFQFEPSPPQSPPPQSEEVLPILPIDEEEPVVRLLSTVESEEHPIGEEEIILQPEALPEKEPPAEELSEQPAVDDVLPVVEEQPRVEEEVIPQVEVLIEEEPLVEEVPSLEKIVPIPPVPSIVSVVVVEEPDVETLPEPILPIEEEADLKEVLPQPEVLIEEEPIVEILPVEEAVFEPLIDEIPPQPEVLIEEEAVIEVLLEPVLPLEEEVVVEPISEEEPISEPEVLIEDEPIGEVLAEPIPPLKEEVDLEPVTEAVAISPPFGITPIVKSSDGSKTFDLVIVHTNDVKNNIYTEDGGVGLARLSSMLKQGRALSDNWLVLNTGDVGSLAPEYAETAALVVDEIGYDAYLPFAIQGTEHARSLAINALDEEGYFVAQPYQLYDYNGFIVGVIGVVAPKDISGVTFDSDLVLDNAQYAVGLAHEFVDYLIVLSDLGDGIFSSTDLAQGVEGINLIIDGSGFPLIDDVNNTLIVRSSERLTSIGAVVLNIADGDVFDIHVLDFSSSDVLHPSASELLQGYEPFVQRFGVLLPPEIEEDPAIVALIGPFAVEEEIVPFKDDGWFAFDEFDWDAFDEGFDDWSWDEEPIERSGPPSAPYIFEPMTFTEEEYDLFYPAATQPLAADDDFWSDFFVVGEDTQVAYDDGTYYFRLFVNEDLMGTIEVHFEKEERLISVEDLRYYISDHLTSLARTRIFTGLGEFVTPQELESRGIRTHYDETNFALYLNFSVADMPERILSLSSATVNRREQYAISGAIPLKPQWFSLASSLSLFGQLEYPDDFSTIRRELLNLSVSNRASLFGVALNFNFTLSHKEPYYLPGSWSGYYDFVDQSIRLSFGNIGSGLGRLTSVSGTQSSVGVSLEKNYSFGTASAKRAQIEETLTIVEDSNVEIFLNDNFVFTRTLKPGIYRLKDFILVQGANRIRIDVTPISAGVDGVPTSTYLNLGYDYRLMAKGDTTYAIGLSMPRTRGPNKEGSFFVPWLGGDYLSYHPKVFTVTYRQEVGVTDAMSMNIDLAYAPGTLQASLGVVFATMIGSTQIQGSSNVNTDTWEASYNVNFGQRFSVKETSFLNRIGLSGNYNRLIASKGNASISLSYSDSLFNKLRYSISGSGAYSFDGAIASYSASLSTGFSPFKGFSISGSVSLSGSSYNPQPTITGQISGSYSISSKASVSTSNSIKKTDMTSSMSMSLRPSSNDSISVSYGGIRTEFDGSSPQFTKGSLSGSWNHTGTFSSLNLRQQYSLAQQSLTTTVMVNTALAYAGGAFGLGRSVSDSFLLAKPTGLLKKGRVSVARSLDSGPTDLSRPFGSALYNGLSTNTTNSVVVFSSGPTEFSTGHSFVYSITPRGRQSFVAKLAMQPEFTVSGVLLQKDGTPYSQYSSPVYRITYDQKGDEVHNRDETLYLFTDQDGRYILNEVKAGEYLFDLEVEDQWYGVRFEIPEQDAKEMGVNTVLLLESYQVGDPAFESRIRYFDKVAVFLEYGESEDTFGVEAADEYDARLSIRVTEQTDEESFWNTIFPPFEESDFFSFDDGYVTDEDFFFDPFLFDELVGEWESATPSDAVVTAAP